MADVLRFEGRSPAGQFLTTQRAEALLGLTPIFTFQPDPAESGTCCSVRLVRGEGDAWLGLVRDRSFFAERVRLGLRPRFVVHHAGETPVVCGEADVRVRGRASEEAVAGPEQDVVKALFAQQAFASDDLVVIEVRLAAVQVDDGEAPLHGAIPRT